MKKVMSDLLPRRVRDRELHPVRRMRDKELHPVPWYSVYQCCDSDSSLNSGIASSMKCFKSHDVF